MSLAPLLLATLMSMSTPVVPPESGRPAAQQAPLVPPAQDPELQKRINELKLRAIEANDKNDLKTALKLYTDILKLDPNDAMALQQRDKVQATIAAQGIKATADRLAELEKEARDAAVRGFVSEADQHLVKVTQTHSREELRQAEEKLRKAKQAAQGFEQQYPELADLEARVTAAIAAEDSRWYWLWGGIGILTLAALALLFFLIWRRGRVLEMIAGPIPGQTFALRKETTTVGALAGEVDWPIVDPQRQISRCHCIILRRGRHYWVVDRSTNGTFLNGRPIKREEATLIKPGDQISLGRDVVLRFR